MIILFVDDEEMVLLSLRRSLNRWLKHNKLKSHFASSSKDAIEFIKNNNSSVGVIVTDQKMPDLTGSKLLSIIKKKYPEIISIVLSGHSDLEDIDEFLKAGVFSFLQKPWNIDELKRELVKAINYYNINQENKELKKNLNKELQLASEFQKGILKLDKTIKLPFGLYITYLPSPTSGISGDYYDLIKIDDFKYFILLGDVSGHGIKPAFISIALKSFIQFEYKLKYHTNCSSSVLTNWLNKRLFATIGKFNDLFVSFTVVFIDIKNKKLNLTNSGQPSPILKRNNSIGTISNNNMVLGINEEATYKEVTKEIIPGDEFILVSDGLHPTGNNFSITNDEYLSIFLKSDTTNHKELLTNIENCIPKNELEDDKTIITIKIKEV